MSDPAAETPLHATPGLDSLLRDVAAGDQRAFESLYRSSAPRLMAICLRVLHDRGEAEDVLQEVYVRIWHKAAQFDAGKASAMTWLGTIARNRAIDRVRSRPSNVQLAPVELVDALPDDGATPAQAGEQADDNARLQACMDTLEPKRRGLIRAAFFDGSTYEELARRAGSPLGSVKSWIRRGLLQLRACLEQ
ncbi:MULTISPECIES: sigma-70 family RNA polymerase sigma factor [Luteimonas]|uniref:sigma-70 family RNA polymerase sigma factor n=1 Tax=Luteimonas TaxID=83614 RepID=UPI000C7E6F79|nr:MULTISPECIES: sigma-70 family RNA polymerase sigma factor [Luteimonas]